MSTKSPFYITTAIPYVNGRPHIGHALEFVQADALAQLAREAGRDVFFLTGTDENSIKNVQGAEKAGMSVQVFVDENAKAFIDLARVLDISNDDFIRTTEKRHHVGAQALWNACAAKGDLYKKTYEGLYCNGCEAFYLEKDLENGLCPEHKTAPEVVQEENWFFKLTNYQRFLEDAFKSGRIRIHPASRQNETTSFIAQGLQDFSVSRSNARAKNWGIPVPGDDTQMVYTWYDALANYVTALGYGAKDDAKFQRYWMDPASRPVHVIGKGITKFHAIYWPAMLESAGIFPPGGLDIFVHGYVTVDGEKISKSLGNTVDPFALVETYGADAVRYFLLREIPTFEDGDFSTEKFVQRYNSDLANGLGNLVSRVTTLAEKYAVTHGDAADFTDALGRAHAAIDDIGEGLSYTIGFVLQEVMGLVRAGDAYMELHAPFKKEKTEEERLHALASLTHLVANIPKLLAPFMPGTASSIAGRMGTPPGADPADPATCFAPKKGDPLFQRINLIK